MIELHSRIARIGGNGCGYRDIKIHEMTESEIESLRFGRWVYAAYGLLFGMVLTATIHWFSLSAAIAKYCP